MAVGFETADTIRVEPVVFTGKLWPENLGMLVLQPDGSIEEVGGEPRA